MFIKVSMVRRSRLVIFTSRKSSVFCMRRQVACEMRCLLLSKAFRRPWPKNYISGYIWHKSFIRTVKHPFFNQIIVCQSFYGALLTFSYFLLPGICLARVGKSLASYLAFWRRPWRKAWFRMHLRMFTGMNKKLFKVLCAMRASVHKSE